MTKKPVTMPTCRFCSEHHPTEEKGPFVKYGATHHAHMRCFVEAGKSLNMLRPKQQKELLLSLSKRASKCSGTWRSDVPALHEPISRKAGGPSGLAPSFTERTPMTRQRLPLCLDSELLSRLTEPWPTLREQRRSARERLAKAQADLEKFTRAMNCAELSPEALDLARYMAKMRKIEIGLLEKGIAYLGEPDPRLDLYRIFRINLPPT